MRLRLVVLALAQVLAADAVCDTLPGCGTCLANSGCGWCASSTTCMSITSDGTVAGTCSDFQASQCVGGSHDSNNLSSHPMAYPRLSPAVLQLAVRCGRRAMQLLHDLQLVRARALLHVQQCQRPMRVSVRAIRLASRPPRLRRTPRHATALHHHALMPPRSWACAGRRTESILRPSIRRMAPRAANDAHRSLRSTIVDI